MKKKIHPLLNPPPFQGVGQGALKEVIEENPLLNPPPFQGGGLVGVKNHPISYQLKAKSYILGIDPGLERTGWAILETTSPKPKLIASGLIKTLATEKMTERLLSLHQQLAQILKKYSPTKIIIEELFFSSNVKTALIVGQARGVILLTLAQNKAVIESVTPTALKSALTGYGNAKKSQIQKMLPLLCEMDKPVVQDDIADAIALAWWGCK